MKFCSVHRNTATEVIITDSNDKGFLAINVRYAITKENPCSLVDISAI